MPAAPADIVHPGIAAPVDPGATAQIRDHRQPLSAGLFVVLDGFTHEPSPFAPDRPKRRWMAVGLPSNGQLPERHVLAERVHPPAQFSRLVFHFSKRLLFEIAILDQTPVGVPGGVANQG